MIIFTFWITINCFLSIFIYVGILNFGPSADLNNSALIFQVVSQKLIVFVFVFSVLHQTFGFYKLNGKGMDI